MQAALLPATPSRASTWFGRGVPGPISRLLAGSWVLFALSLMAVLISVLLGDWSSGTVISLLAFGGMTAFICLIVIPLFALSAFSLVKQVEQLANLEPLAHWAYSSGDLERLAASQAPRRRRGLRIQVIVAILGLMGGLALWPGWHGFGTVALSLLTAAALWLCAWTALAVKRGTVFPRTRGLPQILLTAEGIYQPGPPTWFMEVRGGVWSVQREGDVLFLQVVIVSEEAQHGIRIAVPEGAEDEARELQSRLHTRRR